MSLDFKWFLAVSVAAHAAVLLAWVPPPPEAGTPGQVLLLDITHKTGRSASLPAIEAGSEHRQSAVTAVQPSSPRKHAATARKVISKLVGADTVSTNTDQPDSGVTKSSTAHSEENLAASSPLPSHDESDRQLRNSVMQLVTQRLSYPAIARRRGWQGVVTLELHIESDGFISDLQVTSTSGYPALDQAAMKSLQLASIPGAGQWLHGRSIDMLIPVEYRLLEG